MTTKNTRPKPIKPLPYYTTAGSVDDSRLAAALRSEFVGKVKRLLPGHHLGGFRHDFIVSFVKRHKQKFPCYVRTDIAKFYPSVRHTDLIVGCQIAYRDLLNLDYVPRRFKEKYVAPLVVPAGTPQVQKPATVELPHLRLAELLNYV